MFQINRISVVIIKTQPGRLFLSWRRGGESRGCSVLFQNFLGRRGGGRGGVVDLCHGLLWVRGRMVVHSAAGVHVSASHHEVVVV
jgi:hypothetical protein